MSIRYDLTKVKNNQNDIIEPLVRKIIKREH